MPSALLACQKTPDGETPSGSATDMWSGLRALARTGDKCAVQYLHFGDGITRQPDPAWHNFVAVAGPHFRRIVDAWVRRHRPALPAASDAHPALVGQIAGRAVALVAAGVEA
jgi:hypothetical protein